MASRKALKQRFYTALLLGAASVQAAVAAPLLAMTYNPAPAVAGSTFHIAVEINGITDLYRYQFALSFDPSKLQATGPGMPGPFLGPGPTFFDGGTVDNAAGSISVVRAGLIGDVPGANFSGSLAHFIFNVVAPGVTDVHFSNVLFVDSHANELAVEPHDLKLLAVARVPEPGAHWLLAIGVAGLAVMRRRT